MFNIVFVGRYLFTIVSYLIGVFVFATIVGTCQVFLRSILIHAINAATNNREVASVFLRIFQ